MFSKRYVLDFKIIFQEIQVEETKFYLDILMVMTTSHCQNPRLLQVINLSFV
jgi:hypothetical protein